MGRIITVVAVFDIHIERPAVIIMKPKSNLQNRNRILKIK